VFLTPVTFLYNIDHPAFHIVKSEELIHPHKESRIAVGFDAPPASLTSKLPVVAKLVVTCSKPYSLPNAASYQWIFYLRGIIPEGKDVKEGKDGK
jgi:hypothetical protein